MGRAKRSLTYDLEGVGRSSRIIPDLIRQFGSTEVNWGLLLQQVLFSRKMLSLSRDFHRMSHQQLM